MAALIALIVSLVVAGALVMAYRRSRNCKRAPHQPASPAERELELRRLRQVAEQHEHTERQKQLAKNLQIAFLQLEKAPDFRRAASWSALGVSLPIAFRQRQFKRFRMRLVQHAAARLGAGEPPEALLESLRAIVHHLGVAQFEADYIWALANDRVPHEAPPTVPGFEDQMRTLQQEHAQRMSVLRNMPGLDREVREQLLEAEQQRFRDSLLGRDEQPRSGAFL